MATPKAVEKQGKAAEKMQKELAQGKIVTLTPPAQEPAQEPVAPVVTPVVESPVQEPVQEPAGPEDYKHKYEVLQGMFKAEVQKAVDSQSAGMVRQLTDANTTIANLNTLLVQTQAQQLTATPAGQIDSEFSAEGGGQATPFNPQPLEESDFEGYGEEMVDMVKLVNSLIARNKELESQVNTVEGTVQLTGQDAFYKTLTDAIPNWQAVNKSQGWLNWLALPDPFSGVVRDDLLQQAFQALDTARVLNFFNAYLQESGMSPAEVTPSPGEESALESQLVPDTGGSEVPVIPQEQIITRQQYNKAVQDRVLGKITEEEFNKISAAFQNTIARGQVQ